MARRGLVIRVLVGAFLGAVLTTGFFSLIQPMWVGPPVTAEAVERYGSPEGALVVQILLASLLGVVVALASLPFPEGGRALILMSLAHFGATALSFGLLLVCCGWVGVDGYLLMWVALLAAVYALIWMGRWIGWYVEIIQLRELLGLAPGPSPLKWRETLPYLPWALLLCDLLPVVLRGMERVTGVDVPVLSGLILPYLLLPVISFCVGLSLGKRQGICPLFPIACWVCYLPMVWLLFNRTALFHCFLTAVPALVGNVAGWGLDKVRRR